MSNVLAQELIEAGVHFGHRASRWNPKMRPYIHGRKNLIHIIDVRETIRGLLRARKYLTPVAATGSLILFVGTKRQGSEAIAREAGRCGMPYVSDRWLGGTLTNFRTIRNRLARLEELETLIPSDKFATYSKKMQSSLRREHRKMLRNLGGIRTLSRLPECLVVFDPKKELKEQIGTPYYIAPEVLNRHYGKECDIWSTGVIAYIILSGIPPFNGGSDQEIMKAIKIGKFNCENKVWNGISQGAKDFIT